MMARPEKDTSIKTLIVMRHAHRDATDRRLDNGLSDKGMQQAKRLSAFYAKRFESHWPAVYSSPKRRCLETLQPIVDKFNLSVQESRWLLEQADSEDHATFVKRLDEFFEWWYQQEDPLTIVCTHGDWISTAMNYLFGFESQFKKGCWIELQQRGDKVSLQWLVQTFKYF